jgi:alkylation response protein AidB-like acyl-CoA dehydrogenase
VDFELNEEQRMLRDTVRRFVIDKVEKPARQWDRQATFPADVIRELGEMGLLGVVVATEWEGAGLSLVELALVTEELARGDASLALAVGAHASLAATHLQVFGSAAQKERFLRPLARGEQLGAWCLAGPTIGTDAGLVGTTAARQGDHWLLNGVKTGVVQGAVASIYVVLAVADGEAPHSGATAFILEPDMTGFARHPHNDDLGFRAAGHARIELSGVRVPDANRIGGVGEGTAQVTQVLEHAQIVIGAVALGLSRGAVAAARSYALERKQFGKPLAEFEAIQWKLADISMEADAAALLVYRAAWLAAKGMPFAREAAMARLFAAEAAMRAADEAIQVHGGYGYTAEFPVERFYRDARLCAVVAGTSDEQRTTIGRLLLQE